MTKHQGKEYTREERIEIIDKICHRMIGGESLKRICDTDETLPNRVTLLRWLNDPTDELATMIARAREFQAEALDDEMQEITTKMLEGGLDPQAARVAIWAAQWRAARLKPKKYGDKVQTEVSGPDGQPQQVKWTVEFVNAPEKT